MQYFTETCARMAPMIAVGASILILFFRCFWPPQGTSFAMQRKEMPDPAGTLGKLDSQRDPASYDPAIVFSAGGPDFMVQV